MINNNGFPLYWIWSRKLKIRKKRVEDLRKEKCQRFLDILDLAKETKNKENLDENFRKKCHWFSVLLNLVKETKNKEFKNELWISEISVNGFLLYQFCSRKLKIRKIDKFWTFF